MRKDEAEVAIDSYMKSLTFPEGFETVVGRLRYDLWSGPLYLTDYKEGDFTSGEDASCFDEGAIQFPFSSAADYVAEQLEQVQTIYADCEMGENWSTNEPQGEYLDGEEETEENWIEPSPYYELTPEYILREYLGSELYQTLYR